MGFQFSVGTGRNKSSSSSKASQGCLILFLLPFFGVGFFTIFMGIKFYVTGEKPLGEALFFVVFGLIFAGVATVILIAGLSGSKLLKKQDALKTQHPNEPWLWREDWASGRIRSSEKAGLYFIWFFAIFWNAISIPAAVLGIPEVLRKGEYAGLLILLFPLVGAGLLWWAIYMTMRHAKFGVSTFEPAAVPGVIGGLLQGQVQGKVRLNPGEKMKLRLTNFQRYTSGSGKNRSTSYRVVWQQEKEIGMEHLSLGMHGGSVVPVEFFIPRDGIATTAFGGEDGYLWRLEVSAEVPGVNFNATFEVPVFVTEESDAPVSQQLADYAQKETLAQGPPAALGVRIAPTPAGGVEYYWAPARRKVAALLMTLLTTGFGVGMYFCITKGAPIIASIIVGFFLLILALITLSMWTSSSRLVIENGRARVLNKFAGFGQWKELAAPDIADVQPVVGSSSNNTAYYYISLKLNDGKKIKLGNGMEGQLESQWLSAQIKEQLKKKPW